jgi:hypothetical protein
MALPRRIPLPAKRDGRWRSPAHTKWIAGFACVICGSMRNTVAAHVRLGSHAGMGMKPDDWRCVPLCDGPHSNADGQLGCHDRQHIVGEETFWKGRDVEAMIEEFIAASPKRADIRAAQRERREAA